MAYIPTVWATGDIITAEKLNNIEDGIVANEPVIFEGDIITTDGLTYTFTLTHGDVADLQFKENVYMKGTVKFSNAGADSPLADVLLPLLGRVYNNGDVSGYNFSCVALGYGGQIAFFNLFYNIQAETWSATVTPVTTQS